MLAVGHRVVHPYETRREARERDRKKEREREESRVRAVARGENSESSVREEG